MDPLLAIGQILVSIALIVAILLQARGVGLSGTFGGDSAVYRSRRGVERRLWQFTIVLLVLFVVFSPGGVRPRPGRHRLIRRSRRPTATGRSHRSSMTRTDSLVVGTLVVLLALIAGLVGVPSLLPGAATVATPQPTPGPIARRPAVPRRRPRPARLGQPAHRPDPGRPRPRRARLLGPRPERPERDARARPRRALVGRPDRPDLDVPAPRRRPLARRRAGHRRRRRLHDPRPPGPGLHRAGRRIVERGHASRPMGRGRSSSPWRRRSAGSSRPRPSRSRRRTCWPTSRSTELADDPFGRQPIGSGPFAVASLDDDTAELIPAATVLDRPATPPSEPSPDATDSLGHARRPDRPTPARCRTSPGSSSTSSTTRRRSPTPIARASSTPPRACRRTMTRDLATAPGSRALDYPGSTLTAVLLNLRPGHPEFADPAVRTALLEAIDRPTIVSERLRDGRRPRRRGPIPPSSSLFDPPADPPVAVRPGRRGGRAQEGRLDQGRRRLASAEGEGAARRSSCSARTRRPTRPPSRRPRRSPTTGRRSASAVTHVALAAGRRSSRAAWRPASSRPRSAT